MRSSSRLLPAPACGVCRAVARSSNAAAARWKLDELRVGHESQRSLPYQRMRISRSRPREEAHVARRWRRSEPPCVGCDGERYRIRRRRAICGYAARHRGHWTSRVQAPAASKICPRISPPGETEE